MTAGERVFVDLLPDTWNGPPPALPLEVVRELAERARVAERALRQLRATTEAQKRPPIRVRASVQPTFVRFVFEMPDGVGVSSVLNDRKLTLSFNAMLTFDLADAKVAAPSNVASINQRIDGDIVRGGSRADRRCRCPLLPRGEKLHYRHRLPASGETVRRCRRPRRMPRMLRRRPHRRRRRQPIRPRPRSRPMKPPGIAGNPVRLCRRRRRRSRSRQKSRSNPRCRRLRPKRRSPSALQGKSRLPQRRRRKKQPSPRPSRRLKPGRRRRQRRHRRSQAKQRRAKPDVFLCHRHASGVVSSRRYRVAGV